MAHSIAIPKLGLTMTDCTLVGWTKADGDRVEQGDILYAIETDKITSDVEADAAGFLRRFAEVDTTHEVGAVVGALFATREEALAAESAPTAVVPASASILPSVNATDAQSAPPAAPAAVPNGRRLRISPLARRIAAQSGIDPATVTGTGSGGAILRRDVEAASRAAPSSASIPQPPSAMPPSAHATAAPPQELSRRPLAGMRRAISNRMMQSLQGSAQMTGFGRVDMGEAMSLLRTFVAAEPELGVRMTVTDIVLKAAAHVMADMPEMNASIVGDEIVSWGRVNVGLAVALEDGLVVPVIHDADRMSLVEIAHARKDLATRARANQLTRDDLEGGTFSLSNFGSYGGDFETPILNPPQSSLLGIGRVSDEPAVRDGQIVIRPIMTMSLTFDHRLIDGAMAGRFRSRLRSALESPGLMMARMR